MSTTFPVNDAMAQKMWAKELTQAERDTSDIEKLIGESADSVIHRKTDFSKKRGDQVTYGLRTRLTGAGFTEGEKAEGNGETLSIFSDAIVINELGNTVRTRSDNTIDAQRVPFDLRSECKDGLRDWFKDRKSLWFFNHVCGYTPANTVSLSSGPKFTGYNTVVAPSSGRQIWAGTATNDQGLTNADTFVLSLIDRAKEIAMTGNNMVRPVSVGGQPKYMMYLDVSQVTSLRTNTATGQWQDITKFSYSGVDVSKNPLYTGALGEYNGVILRSSQDITQGVNSSSGAAVTTVRRAVLLGAQAAAMGVGNGGSSMTYRWSELLKDHDRELEVGAWTIAGLKKCRFNNADFGTVVVSTYAARAA